jgi:trk system potassium uptake protein TrkA
VNVIITGGGLVGSTLAKKLVGDGHDVSIVESNPETARELDASVDAQIVVGDATRPSVLEQANIASASLLIASTDTDSENLMVGVIASHLYQVDRVIVRIRDPEKAETFLKLTADQPGESVCVNPEAAAVNRILNLLEVPGALDVVPFFGGDLLVAGFRMLESADFVGLTLQHMNLMFPDTPTLATAIHRGNTWIIPRGEEEICAGDCVYFAIPRHELENVLSLIGTLQPTQPNVMIAGATRMGLEVARRLEKIGRRTILIEENGDAARDAAAELGDTIVVHGHATDQALLEEEEIERVSTFVAVRADHEENLVSGLLAKRLGAGRIFALVDNPALADLIGEVGIDAVISPRSLAVGLLLQSLRRGRVLAVEALADDRIEILEIEAVEKSRLTKKPLAKLGLPANVLVAAIRREGRLLVPGGDMIIQPGDQVLLVTGAGNASQLDAFLSAE